MSNAHEPRHDFVIQLAARVADEARRRNRSQPSVSMRWAHWLVARPVPAAIAVLVGIGASMTIGGAVVAARYQAQTTSDRAALTTSYEQRVSLARQRATLAADELHAAQQRVAIGVDSANSVTDAQVKVTSTRADIQTLELDLMEVGASGREPLDTMSAPLVDGRDFVTERGRVALSVPVAALNAEQTRLAGLTRRASIGVAVTMDEAASRARIGELQAVIVGLQRKLETRHRFTTHAVDATMADLLGLESDAQQRRDMLVPRLGVAQQTIGDLATKVQMGLAPAIDLIAARVRAQEIQLDARKADLDLAMIQRQIQQYRPGR